MIIGWIWVTGIAVAGYVLLMIIYSYCFRRLSPFLPSPAPAEPNIFFSVLIPARNETESIAKSIDAVFGNTYPPDRFEVLVIDDFSEDDTPLQVIGLQKKYRNLRLIQLKDYPAGTTITLYKKQAIETGIRESRGTWIVTTDADAHVPSTWLSTLHAYIQQHDPVFIASPVIFHAGKSILSVFQEIDFMTMQGITAASVSAGFHSMCNGANLAYRKDCFYKVGGFSGNEHLATGDDMLLMHKMKKTYPNKMGYIFSREAIVSTDAQKSWREFFQQRIRWASKADSYGEPVIFGVLLWVWVMNTLLLAGLLLSLFEHNLVIPWLIIIAVKTMIELFFLLPVATFFKRKSLLIYFPFLQPVHLLYIVLSGWLGKFGSYEWKNRVMNTSSRQ